MSAEHNLNSSRDNYNIMPRNSYDTKVFQKAKNNGLFKNIPSQTSLPGEHHHGLSNDRSSHQSQTISYDYQQPRNSKHAASLETPKANSGRPDAYQMNLVDE